MLTAFLAAVERQSKTPAWVLRYHWCPSPFFYTAMLAQHIANPYPLHYPPLRAKSQQLTTCYSSSSASREISVFNVPLSEIAWHLRALFPPKFFASSSKRLLEPQMKAQILLEIYPMCVWTLEKHCDHPKRSLAQPTPRVLNNKYPVDLSDTIILRGFIQPRQLHINDEHVSAKRFLAYSDLTAFRDSLQSLSRVLGHEHIDVPSDHTHVALGQTLPALEKLALWHISKYMMYFFSEYSDVVMPRLRELELCHIYPFRFPSQTGSSLCTITLVASGMESQRTSHAYTSWRSTCMGSPRISPSRLYRRRIIWRYITWVAMESNSHSSPLPSCGP